jgi:hypothetical protein
MAGYRHHRACGDDFAFNISFNFVVANNNFSLWVVMLCANTPVLELNLAAQPPKVTIPVMLTSLAINIIVIAMTTVMFLM